MPDEIIIPGGVEEWFGRRFDHFVVGAEHTVFEWCMIYTDRHPAAVLPNHNSAITEGRHDRLIFLGAIGSNAPGFRPHPTKTDAGIWDDPVIFRTSNAIYQQLAAGITSGRLDAKRVYLDDRPHKLDTTLCVIDKAPVLAIARHRNDYGRFIAAILAAGAGPSPDPAEASADPTGRTAPGETEAPPVDHDQPPSGIRTHRELDAETACREWIAGSSADGSIAGGNPAAAAAPSRRDTRKAATAARDQEIYEEAKKDFDKRPITEIARPIAKGRKMKEKTVYRIIHREHAKARMQIRQNIVRQMP